MSFVNVERCVGIINEDVVSDFKYFKHTEKTHPDIGFRTHYQFGEFLYTQLQAAYYDDDIGPVEDFEKFMSLDLNSVETVKVSEFLPKSEIRESLKVVGKSQMEYCLSRMTKFYKYFCIKLLEHPICKSTLSKGLACFDPDIMTGDRQLLKENAITSLANAMVGLDWIENVNVDRCVEEYRSLSQLIRSEPVNLTKDSIGFLNSYAHMKARPVLTKVYRLACLSIGYGPRNLEPVGFNFKGMASPKSQIASTLRTLQSSLYLDGYATETYCSTARLKELSESMEKSYNYYRDPDFSVWSTLILSPS